MRGCTSFKVNFSRLSKNVGENLLQLPVVFFDIEYRFLIFSFTVYFTRKNCSLFDKVSDV